MSEEKFPEPVIDDGLFHSELYEMKDVDDWFKRCMEDFPDNIIDWDKRTSYYSSHDINKWRDKWFSQFVEDV